MNPSKTASCRIVVVCALLICVIGFIGGGLAVLLLFGLLSQESNIFWIRYFVTFQNIWFVPVELYIAIVAVILITARRSIHWSIFLCTVLFAINLGVIRRNPQEILPWIMILSSITGLCVLSTSYTGNLKTFIFSFINDIRYLQQRSVLIWKLVAGVLAFAFVINYLHNEIIWQTSETARDERLLKQYRNAKAESTDSGRIRLEIFSDYQCPACSQKVPEYLEIVALTSREAIIADMRDYPLDSACNDLNPSRGMLPHKAACSAAYAVRLAAQEVPDKVKDFRMWLYANGTNLDDNIISQKLLEIGVNNPQIMFDPEIKQAVRNDLQEAKIYGVNGVPSIVLNGVLLPLGLTPPRLEMLLKFEMTGGKGDVQ